MGFEDCGYPKSYRSNTRMITEDAALANKLYQRVRQCCPETYTFDNQTWRICGLNERFRWCKYVKGQRFGTHCDANFMRSINEQSLYTLNIYLNDGEKDFAGGRTCFFDNAGGFSKHSNYKFTVGVVAKSFQEMEKKLKLDDLLQNHMSTSHTIRAHAQERLRV